MRTTLYLVGALPLVAAQDAVEQTYTSPDHTDSDAAFKAGQGAGQLGSIDGVKGIIGLLDKLHDQSVQAKKDRRAQYEIDREETCTRRQAVLETEMTNGQTLIDEMNAAKTKAEGKVVQETDIVDDCKSAKMTAEMELDDEMKVYASYKKTQQEAMTETTETAAALREASKVIADNANTALLQGAGMQDQLKAMLGGYKAILYALSTTEQAKQLASAMGDDEDLSLAQQPQAKQVAYEAKSGGIIQTLNDMADQAEDKLAQQQQDLSDRTKAHQLKVQSLKNTLKTNTENGADAASRKENAAENAGNYAGKEDEAKAAYKANKETYDEQAKWCQGEAADFESDMAQMSAEIQALKDALKVLQAEFGGGASRSQLDTAGADEFLQVSSSNVRVELVQKLRNLGRKLNSFGLMQLAAAAKNDPFGKIKGLISKMIKKLQEDQAAEQSEKQACDKEKKANKAALKKATSEHDTTASRVGERQNMIADLTESIAQDTAALKELKAYLEEQVEQFNSIKKYCEEKIAALKNNSKAVANARVVLEDGGPSSDSMNNVMQLLSEVQEDFEAQESKTEAYLNKRSATHKTDNATGSQQAAATQQRINGQNAMKASHDSQLQTQLGDLDDDAKELKVATEALAATVKKCAANIMSHADKQKRRQDEIDGLKQALDILSNIGDAAFVQKSMKQTFLGYN